MTWQPYESRGLTVIDVSLADHLNSYLESKEAELCAKIIDAIHSFQHLPPYLTPAASTHLHLHESIEEFSKKVQRLSQLRHEITSEKEWKNIAEKIQESLWKYVDLLEGSTAELFKLLDQINFEYWDIQLSGAMIIIKEMLMHRMDDVIWSIRRLEQQLQELRRICEMQYGKQERWRNIRFLRGHILDSSMESLLAKRQKFLKLHYQQFIENCTKYLELCGQAEQSLQGLSNYRRLIALDLDVQNHIKKIYQLLNLWEFNFSLKALPESEISNALRAAYSPESVLALFREYYSSVKHGLFDKSRMIKKKFREVFNDLQARQPLIDNVVGYRNELNMLAAMCAKYRKFLLATDPYPHTSSGLRFPKWKTALDSKQDKQFEKLIFDIEHLNTLCETFQSAMEKDEGMLKASMLEMDEDIVSHLHDMTQPLASKAMICEHATTILDHLKNGNELTSFDPEVVKQTCKILCKVMKADWKYHLLQGIPLFHQLYDIHYSIVGPLEERQNANRLHKFKSILDQLDHWIKEHEILKHAHEVDVSISDIKAYLQDFFASIQGLKSLREQGNSEALLKAIEKAYEAVLEYRNVFSGFFYRLRLDAPEERLIRKQFLFVDQYFEAIENRLQEIN